MNNLYIEDLFKYEIADMLIIAREQMEENFLLDLCLYDPVSKTHYTILKNEMGYSIFTETDFSETVLSNFILSEISL